MQRATTPFGLLGSTLLLAFFVASVFVGSTAAAQDAGDGVPSIVGSWKVTGDESGETFFGTYKGGPSVGTVRFTSPNTFGLLGSTRREDREGLRVWGRAGCGESACLLRRPDGLWQRTGPLTYADAGRGYVFDDEGVATRIVTTRADVRLAPNGDTARFEFELEDFDGNLLESRTATGTGTRVEIREALLERLDPNGGGDEDSD